jgi:hypothetical protein
MLPKVSRRNLLLEGLLGDLLHVIVESISIVSTLK